MSTARPYLISNLRTGLERDVEPWLLPEDAFPTLEDCYMFRGRIQRRRGFLQLGRIVTKVIAEAEGNVTTPWTSFSGTLTNPDISPGSVSITAGGVTWIDAGTAFGSQTGVLGTSPASLNTGTIDYIDGTFTLTINPAFVGNQAVSATYEYYPKNPVMGLKSREISVINQEQLIGFDTTKSNSFSNTNGRFQDINFHKTTSNAFSWTGQNYNFFYTNNYLGAFWATNGTRGFQNTVDSTAPGSGDGIRWYDGTGWINFLPQVDGSNFLMGSLLIVCYRNRLVMLNTTEGTAYGSFTNYPARARWCQNGTPYYVVPLPSGFTGSADANSWRSDVVGKGGFIDAPTSEQIIGAEFYKDTLVVFFERSTWQLRYTGNETLPFIWERVNIELGAESTFSVVPFDSGIVAISNYGIIASDATGVKRIDQIIPDEVFKIHNGNNGPQRVYGIRDFAQELVYWAFPDADSDPTFPTRVLIYNYVDGSYSFFNDSFTCFGYYQAFNDTTWADLAVAWSSFPYKWSSGQLQSDYPLIVAGNQQGFVVKNFNAGSLINQPTLVITSVTAPGPNTTVTSNNHNLLEGTIITPSSVTGMTQLNGNYYRVSSPTTNTFILQVLNPFTLVWENLDSTPFGTYIDGGKITVINNFNITSKKFNPFVEEGSQVRLQNVDFFIDAAQSTEFTMNIYLDENANTIFQSEAIIPNSPTLSKVWFRTYPSVIGQFVQLELTFSDLEMVDVDTFSGDIVVHGLMLWMSPSGRLTYGSTV